MANTYVSKINGYLLKDKEVREQLSALEAEVGKTAYVLPAAGSDLGGVKSGGDVTISDGIITVNTEAFVSRAGSTMYGDLNTKNLYPTSGSAYNLGSSSNMYKNIYGQTIYENGIALSSKYATPTFVDGKFEALEDDITEGLAKKADTSSLKKVATSGSYNDLDNKPTIPTKTSELTNNSGFATETYVNNKVAGIVDSSPEALNTLNELAAALGDNPNFSTDVLNLIGQKASQADLDILSGDVENLTTEVGKKANTSSLHKVATSGSYNDLTNKPTIPAAVTVDSALSSTSTNPVQNKVINSALAGKANANEVVKLSDNPLTLSTQSSYDCNTCYDGKVWLIAGGNNVPSGAKYGALFTMPYRKASGNQSPDFAGQIFIPNGDDPTKPNSMFYRTALSSSWNPWQEVATVAQLSGYVTTEKLEQVLGSYVNDIDALLGG